MPGQASTQATRGGRWPALAIAGALLFIAALTLFPAGGHPQPPSTCIVCGLRGAADAFLNVLLFMPLGAALAWAGLRAARAVPLGAALSIAVEVAQLWIPGRESSIGDVITNTTGTAAGVLAFQLVPPLLLVARQHARALALALPVATLALLAAGALLLRPAFPPGTYYPVWQPGPDHPYFLAGPVTLARLGDLPLRRSSIPEGALVSALWREGAPLRLQTEPAGDTASDAGLFALYDADGHELLQLGVQGEDVVLRYRTAAALLRLDQPDMRLPGAAAQLRGSRPRGSVGTARAPAHADPARQTGEKAGRGNGGSALPVLHARGPLRSRPGARARLLAAVAAPFHVPRAWSPASPPPRGERPDPSTSLRGRPDTPAAGLARTPPTLVRAWKHGRDYCLEVNGRGACGLGYGVARSWAVLLYPGGLSRWAALLDALWLLGLWLPAGLLLRRASAPLTIACLLVALALLPSLAGLLPTAPGAWLGAAAGVAGGVALRRLAEARRRPAQPSLEAEMRPRSDLASTAMQRSMRS